MIDGHTENYSNQSPYNYVMNMPLIATDPNGMDTYLSGQAAQDFFRQLQQQSSNKSIDEIETMAQSTMQQNGGESGENFTIDPQKLKIFNIEVDDRKIGAVYSYFEAIEPDIENGSYQGGVRYFFGAVITDKSSDISYGDLDWIQRVKTDNLVGKSPNEKLNEWYDDQSRQAIGAGGRYYMTEQEKRAWIAAGKAPPYVKERKWAGYMWDAPRRFVLEDDNAGGTRWINTTWEANISLVNKKNNSTLIVLAFGFSITNGKVKTTTPTKITRSN